jgi:mycothiol system anti-sigma-R factor
MKPGDWECVDCAGAMERLHEYVDRELTADELRQVRMHLDDCPPCQRHFDFEEHFKLLVHRKACPETAPPALLDRILGSLKHT